MLLFLCNRVSLLVFHLALVNNPQDALVIGTFASLLYHGTWREGVKAAGELSGGQVNFAPEICISSDDLADEKLAQRVSKFASVVLDSISALNDAKRLRKIMGRCPSSSRPIVVSIFLTHPLLAHTTCTTDIPSVYFLIAISMN